MNWRSLVTATVVGAATFTTTPDVEAQAKSQISRDTVRVCYDHASVPKQFKPVFSDAWNLTKSFYDDHGIHLKEATKNCTSIQHTMIEEWFADHPHIQLPDSIDASYFDKVRDTSFNETLREASTRHLAYKTEVLEAINEDSPKAHYKLDLPGDAPSTDSVSIHPYNTLESFLEHRSFHESDLRDKATRYVSKVYAHELGHTWLLPHPERWKNLESRFAMTRGRRTMNVMNTAPVDANVTDNEYGYTMSAVQRDLITTYLDTTSQLNEYEGLSDDRTALKTYWEEQYPSVTRDVYVGLDAWSPDTTQTQ